MAIHCAAAEHGGLIKKKEKESSWVKLKAFATTWGGLISNQNRSETKYIHEESPMDSLPYLQV